MDQLEVKLQRWADDVAQYMEPADVDRFLPLDYVALGLLDPKAFDENWWPILYKKLRVATLGEADKEQFARLAVHLPGGEQSGKPLVYSCIASWLNPVTSGIVAGQVDSSLLSGAKWSHWHTVSLSYLLENPSLGSSSLGRVLGCIRRQAQSLESREALESFVRELYDHFTILIQKPTSGLYILIGLIVRGARN